jgi:glucose/mannose transport system permease protein
MAIKRSWKISGDDLAARGVLLPTVLISMIFVYGFIIYTIYLSFTNSTLLPSYELVGLKNYIRLFGLTHWHVAVGNMGIFLVFYIGVSTLLGLLLAIMIDLNKLGERFFRPVYLYPMAISFIVTGTAWKWFLDPGIGLENIVQMWGWESFQFDWIKSSTFAIYTVIMAAIWQVTGFVMVLFIAGLRGIDHGTIESGVVDGATSFQLYTRVIIPQLAPSFLSVFVILGHMAIKSYDLVVALTGGGPGFATALPSTFMYSYTFTRTQMGVGAAAAVCMLAAAAIIVVPYLRTQLKEQ